MIKHGINCPHCGAHIDDVTEINVEVRMTKADWILSAGIGLGLAFLTGGAWNWWGAAGVFFLAACITFLITRTQARKGGASERSDKSGEVHGD